MPAAEPRVGPCEEEVRFEPVGGVADVMASGTEDDAVDRLALDQEAQRVGQVGFRITF